MTMPGAISIAKTRRCAGMMSITTMTGIMAIGITAPGIPAKAEFQSHVRPGGENRRAFFMRAPGASVAASGGEDNAGFKRPPERYPDWSDGGFDLGDIVLRLRCYRRDPGLYRRDRAGGRVRPHLAQQLHRERAEDARLSRRAGGQSCAEQRDGMGLWRDALVRGRALFAALFLFRQSGLDL